MLYDVISTRFSSKIMTWDWKNVVKSIMCPNFISKTDIWWEKKCSKTSSTINYYYYYSIVLKNGRLVWCIGLFNVNLLLLLRLFTKHNGHSTWTTTLYLNLLRVEDLGSYVSIWLASNRIEIVVTHSRSNLIQLLDFNKSSKLSWICESKDKFRS